MTSIQKIILSYIKAYKKIDINELSHIINEPSTLISNEIKKLYSKDYFKKCDNGDLIISQNIFEEIKEWSTWTNDSDPGDEFDYTNDYGIIKGHNNYPIILSVRQLRKILQLAHIDIYHYHKFKIYTNGKKRIITAPGWNLKKRQKWILRFILNNYTLPDCVHGFSPNKSIVTNALCHIKKNEIGCIDIEDFFPSIKSEVVTNIFFKMGYTHKVALELTELCTCDGELPQGAPTSPMLANIALTEFDNEICNYANANQLTYTRYADDITISGDKDINIHLENVIDILLKYGFSQNMKKTHISKGKKRKIVTGLIVSDKIKVKKSYKKKLRQEIYYCKKYGILQHLKNTGRTSAVNFKEYMYGKAYFVKMVEPEVGEKILKQLDEIFSCGY